MNKRTTIILSIFLLAMSVGFTACGLLEEPEVTELAGSCISTVSAAPGDTYICRDYRNYYADSTEPLKSDCARDGGTWAPSTGCSTTENVGYCRATGYTDPADAERRTYISTAAADYATSQVQDFITLCRQLDNVSDIYVPLQ